MVVIDPITELQDKYLHDTHRFILVAAGRRSRKTLIAKQKILYRAISTPETLWFHAAPTYNQAKAIFWKSLKAYTKIVRTKTQPSESNLYVTLDNGSEIHVVGMDKPERIEGRDISWNGCHLAEFGDMKPNAWDNNIRPVLADTKGSVIIDGVPDAVKAGAANHKRLAQYACGGSIPKLEDGVGAYIENPNDPDWCFYGWTSADTLDPEELRKIEETTDPFTFRIEYKASFESVAGKVYYAYTPDYYPNGNLDTSIEYDKNLPIVMCFDFNVNPMTALLGHIKRNKEGNQEWLIFKGYFLKASNTDQLIRRIFDDFPDSYSYFLTPCHSSIARQASQEITSEGYKTDLLIIKTIAKEYGKNVTIRKRTKNPPIHKGISALNSMLHTRKMRMNPNDPGVKELMKDCDSLVYKEGTSAIDESDKMRNHISAGARYLCDYYWRARPKNDNSLVNDMII